MIIRRFEIGGLWGQEGVISSSLDERLNIVTGRNGSGKTTVIKLLWYIISGNIAQARREIDYDYALVETDHYTIKTVKKGPTETRVELTRNGQTRIMEDEEDEDGDIAFDAEQAAKNILEDIDRSLFFPTFRRIEGGFATESISNRNALSSPNMFLNRTAKAKSNLEEALTGVSNSLTNEEHTFVSSISTSDVVSLLFRRYTEMSEIANTYQREVSQEVIDDIRAFENQAAKGQTAESVLEAVKAKIESIDADRERTFAPFDAIQKTVTSVLKHSGITLTGRISFGDAANAVNSTALSAGEKQLLSFICYNAFYRNAVIFIDEPELSLHVDWQRTLFDILEEQGTSNQFIVATHSPFIYSRYKDHEIILNPDRGDD